jgi:4-carboxymuconolactone decarboxylase
VRFKELTEDEMTDAQREVYREVCAGPRGRMGLPTNLLLRCPELARRSAKLGEYIRFGSSLEKRIAEFAVLIGARHWTTLYEWKLHYPQAVNAGLNPDIICDLARGKRPSTMKDDEAIAYKFCTELHENRAISEATFNAALMEFGECGVIELVGVSGYFTLISMVLAVNSKNPRHIGSDMPLPPFA